MAKVIRNRSPMHSAVQSASATTSTGASSAVFASRTSTTPAPQPRVLAGDPPKVSASKVTAKIAADLIVAFCQDHGDLISNLKLQKLLYYTQAWHLALHDKPLFPESFQAWIHGPVQPDVYAAFLKHSSHAIDGPVSRWDVPKQVGDHVADVMKAYGSMTAYDLERLSCEEDPWKKARKGKQPDESSTAEISQDSMKRYYKARLNEQGKRQKKASAD